MNKNSHIKAVAEITDKCVEIRYDLILDLIGHGTPACWRLCLFHLEWCRTSCCCLEYRKVVCHFMDEFRFCLINDVKVNEFGMNGTWEWRGNFFTAMIPLFKYITMEHIFKTIVQFIFFIFRVTSNRWLGGFPPLYRKYFHLTSDIY